MEVSAKTGENIEKIFPEAAKLLFNDYEKNVGKLGEKKEMSKQQQMSGKKTQNKNNCLFI